MTNPQERATISSKPSGVVSLFELLQFYGDFFSDQIAWFSALDARMTDMKDGIASIDFVAQLLAKVEMLRSLSRQYELQSIADQCARIVRSVEEKAQRGGIKLKEIKILIGDLRQRMEDEFRGVYLLHLSPKQSDQFRYPLKEWDFMLRFHETRFNVEESLKCFALERYGASVFHILQAAEFGVIKIANLVQLEGDKPGWSSIAKIHNQMQKKYGERLPLIQKHFSFLESVIPLAIIIKNSWRHKLDHVDNQIIWMDTDFSPNIAEEIISATRAFMRKLANELPRTRGNKK